MQLMNFNTNDTVIKNLTTPINQRGAHPTLDELIPIEKKLKDDAITAMKLVIVSLDRDFIKTNLEYRRPDEGVHSTASYTQ